MSSIKIDSSVTLELDMPKILDKVTNNKLGLFLAHEWTRFYSPYVPRGDSDMLMENVTYKPFKSTHEQPYSHYQFNAIVYIDPIYKVGGFTFDGGITFYSREGVKKIPSNRPLNYSKDKNPQATGHWNRAAEQAGQKEKLIQEANNYLKRL